MCLVLSRCGFDLSAAEWSLSYTESLTSQLLSMPLYSRLSLCALCFVLPTSLRFSDLHLNIVLFKLQSSNFCCVPFVPPFAYAFFFISPLLSFLSFVLQASELGMLSVYYTYIFTSLVRKQEMLRVFTGNIDFTPPRAHQ